MSATGSLSTRQRFAIGCAALVGASVLALQAGVILGIAATVAILILGPVPERWRRRRVRSASLN